MTVLGVIFLGFMLFMGAAFAGGAYCFREGWRAGDDTLRSSGAFVMMLATAGLTTWGMIYVQQPPQPDRTGYWQGQATSSFPCVDDLTAAGQTRSFVSHSVPGRKYQTLRQATGQVQTCPMSSLERAGYWVEHLQSAWDSSREPAQNDRSDERSDTDSSNHALKE